MFIKKILTTAIATFTLSASSIAFADDALNLDSLLKTLEAGQSQQTVST